MKNYIKLRVGNVRKRLVETEVENECRDIMELTGKLIKEMRRNWERN